MQGFQSETTNTRLKDVCAFGMTIAEALAGDAPFPNLQTEGAIVCAVLLEGRRPIKIAPCLRLDCVTREFMWLPKLAGLLFLRENIRS